MLIFIGISQLFFSQAIYLSNSLFLKILCQSLYLKCTMNLVCCFGYL